jgi:hypothetical protein
MKCNTCDNTSNATLYTTGGDFYILGHYGSDYDMQRYALKRGEYAVGNICDSCITDLIKGGKAWLIEDGVW